MRDAHCHCAQAPSCLTEGDEFDVGAGGILDVAGGQPRERGAEGVASDDDFNAAAEAEGLQVGDEGAANLHARSS